MGTALLSALVGGTIAAAVVWLVARRAADLSLRHLELELASLKAQLHAREAALSRAEAHAAALTVEEEQLSGLLGTARTEFARADAEARLLRARVLQLSAAEGAASEAHARLARSRAASRSASRRASRVEQLESRAADAHALAARREAELRAAAERREALEAQLAVLEPLQQRVQSLSQSLTRTEVALDHERARAAERAVELEQGRATLRLEFEALAQRLLEEKGRCLLYTSSEPTRPY